MSKALKIFRIPEEISVKIAAGEVIERPASVVKELIENSIDAGASKIKIEITGGGKKSIKITDNGCGMSHEDAKLCLERFTTSKLKLSGSLLEDIDTLGFRGEALASIASVSRLSVKTRDESSDTAAYLFAEGGKLKDETKTAAPMGTEIEVKNLFFNFPARRKFLKSDKTEQGHIESVVERTALPFLDKDITLICDGKRALEFRKGENLAARIKKLLPKNAVTGIEFKNSAGEYSISGLMTDKATDFRTSSNLIFYVNNRLIKDKIVTHAACDAMRTHITSGRYPGGVIFLVMPPSGLDVNVHPTKAEVRFKDPGFIHEFIHKSIQSSLSAKSIQGKHSSQSLQQIYKPFEQISFRAKEVHSKHFKEHVELKIPQREGYFSNLTVLGQLKNSYIICGDSDGVVIIDQHAAHERVSFERLKSGYSTRSIISQEMLFPLDFELKKDKAVLLKKNLEKFKDLGFLIEEFGENSFIIRSVPEILLNTDHIGTINDILDMMGEFHSSGEIEKIIDEILETMACHSSVRFSGSLSGSEIQTLLWQLDELTAKTCPHGRPFKAALNENDLKRLFKRT